MDTTVSYTVAITPRRTVLAEIYLLGPDGLCTGAPVDAVPAELADDTAARWTRANPGFFYSARFC